MSYLTLTKLLLQQFLIKLLTFALAALDCLVWRIEQARAKLQTSRDSQREAKR